MVNAQPAASLGEAQIMEIGDRVRVRTMDRYNGSLGVITEVTSDDEGVGLITVLFQGKKFGGVEMFAPGEIELLGSNIFNDSPAH